MFDLKVMMHDLVLKGTVTLTKDAFAKFAKFDANATVGTVMKWDDFALVTRVGDVGWKFTKVDFV